MVTTAQVGPDTWVIDIETKPNEVYSWGLHNQNHSISQIIKPGAIMCFAARKVGTERIIFHAEWTAGGYDRMVRELHKIYDQADWIISYNGTSFDSKWIKAAFVQAELPPPSPYREVDLYRVVKKHFQFPSKKLTYVCEALGLDVKVETGGQQLWNSIIRPKNRDEARAAQKLMKSYNSNDIEITEQLFNRLLPWIDGLNAGIYVDDELPVCSNCGSQNVHRRGYFYSTVARYRRFCCADCGKWMRSKSLESSTPLRGA